MGMYDVGAINEHGIVWFKVEAEDEIKAAEAVIDILPQDVVGSMTFMTEEAKDGTPKR